jgi:hypothetical protein
MKVLTWNFSNEREKSDSIQGRIFGTDDQHTVSDIYGHIGNYDALVNFSDDFATAKTTDFQDEVGATRTLADITRHGGSIWDSLPQEDMALRTSGRGFDELDIGIFYYGRSNDYEMRGFKSINDIKSAVRKAGEPFDSYVSPDLLPAPVISSDGPQVLDVPNNAYLAAYNIVPQVHMQRRTYARADMDAKEGIVPIAFESVNTVTGNFADIYAADQRQAVMKKALFVDRSYGIYGAGPT